MKIGVVGESAKDKKGNFHFPENAAPLLNQLERDGNQIYLLDHRMKYSSPESFPAINLKLNKKENIPIIDLDSIYFGKAGKSITSRNQYNSIVEQLQSFLDLVEYLQPFENKDNNLGVRFVNPSETLISNINKQYLLDLSKKTDLPIIPTERITSLDRLIELSNKEQKYIVKPLIAERAKGAIILNDKNKEELTNYFNDFSPIESNGSDLYSKVMSHQGLITQPFLEEFNKYGERKIAIIDGEITTSRKIIGSDNGIVSIHTGGKNYIYNPSSEEQELAKRAFNEFNKINKANYARIDIVGKPGNLKISEIEALNPSFSDHTFPEETKYHNKVLSKTIESYLD